MSILEGRVLKVSHSTQSAILQLVDPACTAAREHIETRIWNFHLLSVVLPNCGYGVFRQLKQVEELEKSLFFVWAIILMKTYPNTQISLRPHT